LKILKSLNVTQLKKNTFVALEFLCLQLHRKKHFQTKNGPVKAVAKSSGLCESIYEARIKGTFIFTYAS